MSDDSSGNVPTTSTGRAPSALPLATHHWFFARSLNRIVGHRLRSSQYEERLVVVDAPDAATAVRIARKEARKYPLRGMTDLGVFDVGPSSPTPEGARGQELVQFSHRSSESVDDFVERRFWSGALTTGRTAPLPDRTIRANDEPFHGDVVVVRSLHHSDAVSFAARRPERLWVERFTAYETISLDEALEWSEDDCVLYGELTGLQTFPLWEAHLPFVPLADGAEVFSVLRTSRKGPRTFRRQITGRSAE